MIPLRLAQFLIVLFVVACHPCESNADSLTYSGVEVLAGAIDGVDLTGQTASITIHFADDLTATGQLFNLGELSYAAYEFSESGLFTIDTPQTNLKFGSFDDMYELSFFHHGFDLRMLSGTTAGDIGLDPISGETMSEMFARLGDGQSIEFISADFFQMLNTPIGALNGGNSFVTTNIAGTIGNTVTLTLNAVPEPSSSMALAVIVVCVLRRRKSHFRDNASKL